MPNAQTTALASWLLATAVMVVALALAARQAYERQCRDPDLSDEDDRHFAQQDGRRFLGAGVMALLALGIAFGSHIDPLRSVLNRRLFGAIWAAVVLMLVVLLVLAWIDWLATLSYARRHRQAIANERRAVIEAERRRRAFPTNGQGSPPLG